MTGQQQKEYIITEEQLVNAQLWNITPNEARRIRSRPAPQPDKIEIDHIEFAIGILDDLLDYIHQDSPAGKEIQKRIKQLHQRQIRQQHGGEQR